MQTSLSISRRTYQAYFMLGFSLVTGLVLAAFLIWVAYLCILAIVLGLQLLVTTFNQLTALISDTPVFHFLFVLGLLCLITMIVRWMITKTYKYVLSGVQYGRI